MPKVRVVAFSGKMQHGKTTCAEFLEQELVKLRVSAKQITRSGFAAALKGDLYHLGLDPQKKTPIMRRLMQAYGQAQRERDPMFWVSRWEKNLPAWGDDEWFVLVDDMRFRNEFDVLKAKYQATMVRVVRFPLDESSVGADDISETDLDGYARQSERFDYYVVANEGDLTRLQRKMADVARALVGA